MDVRMLRIDACRWSCARARVEGTEGFFSFLFFSFIFSCFFFISCFFSLFLFYFLFLFLYLFIFLSFFLFFFLFILFHLFFLNFTFIALFFYLFIFYFLLCFFYFHFYILSFEIFSPPLILLLLEMRCKFVVVRIISCSGYKCFVRVIITICSDPFLIVMTLHFVFVRDDTQNCFDYNRIFCSDNCSHLFWHFFVRDGIQTCSGYNNILFCL
jgi:hypothetical protein